MMRGDKRCNVQKGNAEKSNTCAQTRRPARCSYAKVQQKVEEGERLIFHTKGIARATHYGYKVMKNTTNRGPQVI